VLFLVAGIALGGIAHADETSDRRHCTAAFDAGDWHGVAAYCTTAAEDESIAGQNDTGDKRALDLLRRASDLIDIGMAYSNLQDSRESQAYAFAKVALIEAQHATTNASLLFLVAQELRLIPKDIP